MDEVRVDSDQFIPECEISAAALNTDVEMSDDLHVFALMILHGPSREMVANPEFTIEGFAREIMVAGFTIGRLYGERHPNG